MDCSVLHTDVKDSQNELCHLVKVNKMNLQVHSQIQILGSKTIGIKDFFYVGRYKMKRRPCIYRCITMISTIALAIVMSPADRR